MKYFLLNLTQILLNCCFDFIYEKLALMAFTVYYFFVMPDNHMKTYSKFKHIFAAAFLFIAILFNAALSSYADTSLKIKGLIFDNSDNFVLINSTGKINTTRSQSVEDINYTYNEISKGFLKEPERAYVDISNATLIGGSKNYELKNSIFKNVRMSQFSVNPNVVRIVFTYEKSSPQGDFNVIANDKAIAVKYTKRLNSARSNQVAYSNTGDEGRVTFFQNTTSSLVTNPVVPVSSNDNGAELSKMFDKNNEKLSADEKEYHLKSKFYINSIQQSANGIMIKGEGFVSLKPAFTLEEPTRMVIDLDDTVLAKSLVNRSFPIGNPQYEADGTTIKPREILRLGQNSTSVARIVIQGVEAKNYRVVISPDLQNIYIAKRSDVINTKITETESTVKSVLFEKGNFADTLEFHFTNPVAFSAFEENKNLYLDFNNVSGMAEGAAEELKKHYETAQTVRLALDKLRVVLPLNEETLNIQVKVTPDSKTIQAVFKHKERPKESIISKLKDKEMSISNLYKVVIDAGHGGSDVGATREGIYEKDITLAIAKMVEKNLNNKGVKTTMTLEKDKTVSLQERCDISNETRPDLFVSVHVNSSVNNAIYGVETHWWKQDSVKYAETVHKHLGKNFNKWKTKDRGLFKSQFYVINHTEAPAILVEIGFISNENERAAISTQKRQTEIAKAISEGIMDYLKNKGSEE
mgnify:CR=1 FL=1